MTRNKLSQGLPTAVELPGDPVGGSTYYSAAELAAMKIPGVPTSKGNILAMAARENWLFRPRAGRGGGREYELNGLPQSVQRAIRDRATKQALSMIPAPTLPPAQTQQIAGLETSRQRLVADARSGVLKALQTVMQQHVCKQMPAAERLLAMAVEPGNEQLASMLRLARDGRGRHSADGMPSARSILRFVERSESGALAPIVAQRDMTIPAWAPIFLSYYQRPEKPSLDHAYRQFAPVWAASGEGRIVPSVFKVRRFVAKIGNVSREAGRMGPRELKNLRPFKRRSFKHLLPTDVYVADGHTFDAEVQHPRHGKPFKPEITSIVDVATRRLVGWSIDLAESSLAVLDAIRVAATSCGIPGMFYCDNGSGYANAMMSDSGTGIMARMGTELTHSLPYNSQARGVIERLHKTVWVTAAKSLPGYMGRDMDRAAKLMIHKLSRRALMKKANEPMPLMEWERFIAFCATQIDLYNNRPHSSLPKIIDPVTGQKRHRSPNEQWHYLCEKEGFDALLVDNEEAAPLFRPQVLRVAQRAEINLFGNRYFSKALEEFNGEQLAVGYDIHDASRVWVYTDEGRLLCVAQLDGNVSPFYVKSRVETNREKRAHGRAARLETKLDEVHQELHGRPPLEIIETINLGVRTVAVADLEVVEQATPETEPEWAPPAGGHESAFERYEEFKRLSALPAADLPSERAQHWLKSYTHTSEYRGLASLDEDFAEKKLNAPSLTRRSA